MPDSDLILKKAEELVREVRRLLDSPADRAALRHSLGGPPEDATLAVHRIVVRHLPDRQPDEATERAFYAVPAYIAAQPRQARDQDAAAGAHPPGPGRRRTSGSPWRAPRSARDPPPAAGWTPGCSCWPGRISTACTGSCRAWSCTCARTWSGSTGRC